MCECDQRLYGVGGVRWCRWWWCGYVEWVVQVMVIIGVGWW